jgi:hypothetical protein
MDGGREIPEEQSGGGLVAEPVTAAPMPEEASIPEPRPPAGALESLLAGMQAGMVGVLLMLAWLGLSAVWQQRSFWTAENLMASAFYGPGSIHSGFAGRTLPGLALYLVLYSVLGALLGVTIRNRTSSMRTILLSIFFAMVWYYASFHWMWERVMPLVARLHAERPTAIGHLIYGLWLGRFPEYLKRAHPATELAGQAKTEPRP